MGSREAAGAVEDGGTPARDQIDLPESGTDPAETVDAVSDDRLRRRIPFAARAPVHFPGRSRTPSFEDGPRACFRNGASGPVYYLPVAC